MDASDFYKSVRDAAALLNHVGAVYALIFIRASNALKASIDNGSVDVADAARQVQYAIEDAMLSTQDILVNAKVASIKTFISYWGDLPGLWARRRVRLDQIWEPISVALGPWAAESTDETISDFVLVQAEPASKEFVQILQDLSGYEPTLRLMFIEADDPEVVYTADILNEDELDAIVSSYQHVTWRGNVTLGTGEHEYTVNEFHVYTLGGYRIFRSGGYLAACSKSALESLKSGDFLPRMASMKKTASVIRLTFSQRGMRDPVFRDFLRGLGGVQASHSSWDVPIYEENDVEQTLDRIKNGFGYPVMMYQIVDHPKQDIYAYTKPVDQVVRMLSASIVSVDPDLEVTTTPADVSALEEVVPHLQGDSLHTVQNLIASSKILAHYVVVAEGEVSLEDRVCDNVESMFMGARTEGQPINVVIIPGAIPKIVSADCMEGLEDGEEPCCEECAEKRRLLARSIVTSKKMPAPTRETINEKLRSLGFDGNKTFKKVSTAYATIQEALWNENFDLEPLINARVGESGTMVVPVYWNDMTSTEVENSSLFFQWAPRGDGDGVEVVAYLG